MLIFIIAFLIFVIGLIVAVYYHRVYDETHPLPVIISSIGFFVILFGVIGLINNKYDSKVVVAQYNDFVKSADTLYGPSEILYDEFTGDTYRQWTTTTPTETITGRMLFKNDKIIYERATRRNLWKNIWCQRKVADLPLLRIRKIPNDTQKE